VGKDCITVQLEGECVQETYHLFCCQRVATDAQRNVNNVVRDVLQHGRATLSISGGVLWHGRFADGLGKRCQIAQIL